MYNGGAPSCEYDILSREISSSVLPDRQINPRSIELRSFFRVPNYGHVVVLI